MPNELAAPVRFLRRMNSLWHAKTRQVLKICRKAQSGAKRNNAFMDPRPLDILMIEDEARIANWVQTFFAKQGITVTLADDGPLGLHLARAQSFDLIILDLMLPGMDGIEICRRIREESEVPILMLTARNEEADRVRGLNLGADDYVGKPFGLSELLARVQALWRRSRGDVRKPRILRQGAIELNLSDHRCLVNGQPVELSNTQFSLLELFMHNAGRVLTRDQILTSGLGDEGELLDRTIDTHIRRLRQRIEADPKAPRYIQTVFGVGYQFVA